MKPNRWVKKYANFVSFHPKTMLLIVLIVTGISLYTSTLVGTKTANQSDAIPDDIPVIEAFEIIADNFGGSDSVMISVEVNPTLIGSDEIRDLRHPDAIRYLHLLASLAEHTEDVTGATSMGTLLKSFNDGTLPKSRNKINQLIKDNPIVESYLSADYQLAIVRLNLDDQYESAELARDLQNAIEQVPIPPGLDVNLAGEIIADPIIMDQIGPDMAKTSRISLIGILGVLLLLTLSLRYAITPLIVIGLGLNWAFGFFGIIGINLSSQTSGAISMIMGIGIDFGIQTIMRFRHELKKMGPRRAMDVTLTNVFMPMATTTIAALIGFRAMAMGELTILAELGTIMSYGVAACFLAAVTVIPVIAIIGEQVNIKIKERFISWKKRRNRK